VPVGLLGVQVNTTAGLMVFDRGDGCRGVDTKFRAA
jgi:hypothetical protein